MPGPRPWPFALVLTLWLVLVIGAALVAMPIFGLVSPVLILVGAVGLAVAAVRVPNSAPSARGRMGTVLSASASLFLAGLAVYGAIEGSLMVLAWDRASQPGGAAGTPPVGPSVWLMLGALNLLGVALLVVANKLRPGTGLRFTLLLGSAPLAALLCLLAASRFLPLAT